MAEVSVSQNNWVGGELSPKMRGRFDLPIYGNGAERVLNFIADTTGVLSFRTGTRFVNPTRRNKDACLIPFQFSTSQSYDLEFTEGYIRFYTENGIVVLADKTITGATAANPVVITSAAHGYSNGDEVLINDVVGMTELNGRNFVVMGVTANTFQLYDTFGTTPINGTSYTAYSSGGVASKIYEVQTPYLEADLFNLKYAQNADVQYIVHDNYEPRKLTRLGSTNWTLALFTRTSDPFTSKKTITGITQANPAVVTAVGHGYSSGQQIIIETVVGMTQVNSKVYSITVLTANTFSLQTTAGVNVNSTTYGAWSSGGYASSQTLLPRAIAFYQGRLLYGFSGTFPESFWGSKPLDSSGNPQYDDLTVGTNPTDAFKFTLSPITGKVDTILSLVPTLNFLALCTYEGISKADGGSSGNPISPSSIDVTPVVSQGVLREVVPILLGSSLVYIHRSGRITYALEFDVISNAYTAIDKNMTNEHLTLSGVKQMVYRNGRPPMFLLVRNDGVLVMVTTLPKENINGGHRHVFGGVNAKVISVGNRPRLNDFDKTTVVVERTIGGQTVRYVEVLTDFPEIPELDDSFTTDTLAAHAEDTVRWRNLMFEAQKGYVHCDSALTYDGASLFSSTMTPGALTGGSVTFTASSSTFTSSMVGREIWRMSITGNECGRALITAYISSTQVTCRILTDFDSTSTIPAGEWYLTTDSVSGLWHLEGETVAIITDGGNHAEQVVSNGRIELQYQASAVHVGKQYTGFVRSMNVEAGGVNGPAATKPKNINRMGIRFLNTLGAKYGSSLYKMQSVEFRSPDDYTGRPAPLFTGTKIVFFEDETDPEKHVYIVQDKPLPCNVLNVVPFVDTNNQ